MNKLDKENYEMSCLFDRTENVQDLQKVWGCQHCNTLNEFDVELDIFFEGVGGGGRCPLGPASSRDPDVIRDFSMAIVDTT